MVIESGTSRKMMEEVKERAEDEKEEIRSDTWGKISADVYTQEILSYLPASNLQTLKIVCKDWLRLITSPYFVRLHLSRANQNRIRLLLTSLCAIVEYNIYNEEIKQIPYPPKFFRNSAILGSADGLICLVSDEKCLVNGKERATTFTLFNPSTKECLRIQPCPKSSIFDCIICSWFGKRVDGEYILVMGRHSSGTAGYDQFEVYKFTNSNLERIHSISVNMQSAYAYNFRCRDNGILVHGAVHWVARLRTSHDQWRYTIISYHLDENKYSEISPPTHECEFTLGVNVDGCLLAILKNNNMGVFQVLVMKECWTKYAHIEGLNNSVVLSPMGFFPNGDIILDDDGSQLIKYNFKHNKFKVLMQYGQVTYRARIFVDSLVSPSI